MLSRTVARFAFRRSALPFAAAAPTKPPASAFGYGDAAPSNAPGFGEVYKTPPESIKDTIGYIGGGMMNVPKSKEIIEAIGYPGQKHSAGAITSVGRIYYGPGRYDYGRVKPPQGWFANWFYGFWEFGHLMFVTDRWIMMRQVRHLLGIGLCFFPMWLTACWNVEAWAEYKQTHSG